MLQETSYPILKALGERNAWALLREVARDPGGVAGTVGGGGLHHGAPGGGGGAEKAAFSTV